MKKSLFLVVALMTVMVLILTACASPSTPTPAAPAAAPATAVPPAAAPTTAPATAVAAAPTTAPATAVAPTVVPTATDTSWPDIKARGYYVAGITDTYSPMCYRDSSNNNIGFDVDMAKAVADYLGITVKYQMMDWDSKLIVLNNKTIDAIWCGFSITDARKKQVTFTDPYISNIQVVVVPAGSPINSKADLAGKILSWQLGSSADDAVKADPIYGNLAGTRTYNNMPEAFMDMANRRVDAVVLDSIYYNNFVTSTNTASKYKVLTDTFGTETMGVGSSLTNTSWSTKLNEAINAVKTSPAGLAISNKWFGKNVFVGSN
jgi:polar amino acid transport system substrate-binding protein